MIKTLILFMCVLFFTGSLSGQSPINIPSQNELLSGFNKQHPYLLLDADGFSELKNTIENNVLAGKWYSRILSQADGLLSKSFVKEDRSGTTPHLYSCREVMQRTYILGLAYQIEGDEKYAIRAYKELEAAGKWNDWFPHHFLNVGEMTHGFAIGYDWLYNALTDEQRSVIRNTMIDKGINEYLKAHNENAWWLNSKYNWNTVCNGGIGMGALALATDDVSLSREVAFKTLTSFESSNSVTNFGPDGAWSESPGYWAYATKYLFIYLAALEEALGTSFGFMEVPGLSNTGSFPIYMSSTNGYSFNYADGNARIIKAPWLFWLAKKYKNPLYSWYQTSVTDGEVLDLVWFNNSSSSPTELSLPLDGYFRKVEVVSQRSSWEDKNGLFVGMKAGLNGINHSMLETGTFVLDALGERWAHDLGAENYSLPGYWKYGENGKRWTYYLIRAEGNNCLVINPGDYPDQDPFARTVITRFESVDDAAITIADLTDAYDLFGAKSVHRGISLFNNRSQVLVQDDITLEEAGEVWWFMHTSATPTISNNGKDVILTQNGKRMAMQLLNNEAGTFIWMDAEPLPSSPNPSGLKESGKKLALHFENTTQLTIPILFTPLEDGDELDNLEKPEYMELSDSHWPSYEISVGINPPWKNADIGTSGMAGYAGFDKDVFTVGGAGNISEQKDSHHYVYQPICGNAEIILKVDSLPSGVSQAKAGIMMRGALNDSAKNVSMLVSASDSSIFSFRNSDGGTTINKANSGNSPIWLRLVKEDSVFTGYQSNNGTDWAMADTVKIGFPDMFYLGLAVSSGKAESLMKASFTVDTIFYRGVPVPPENLNARTFSDKQIDLIWKDNSANEEYFIIERSDIVDSDWKIIDSVETNITSYSDTGLVPLTYYNYRVRAANSYGLSVVSDIKQANTWNIPPYTPVKFDTSEVSATKINLSWSDSLARADNFILERSTDLGGAWAKIAIIEGIDTSYVDSSLSPANTYTYRISGRNTFGSSSYSVLSVTTDSTGLTIMSPWKNQDIGSPVIAGNAIYSDSTFTVKGSGVDIWDTSDQFQFVYQKTDGDFLLAAKINSITNTHRWAKATLMVRDTLTSNSAHAQMVVSAAMGLKLNYRSSEGSTSYSSGDAADNAPVWLRIIKRGNLIITYYSANGNDWTKFRSITINMTGNVYTGLAVTSHDITKVCTAEFTNIQFPDALPPDEPSGLEATYNVEAGMDLNWRYAYDDVDNFIIERSVGNSTLFSVIASLDGDINEFTDTLVTESSRYNYRVYASNGNGNSAYSNVVNVFFPTSTSIDHVLASDAVTMYPNPVEDVINIASSDVTKIEIFNISGKLVKRFQLNGSPVNVSELAKGVYMVKLIGSTTAMYSFIKK